MKSGLCLDISAQRAACGPDSETGTVFLVVNLHVVHFTKSFINCEGSFRRGIYAKFNLQWKTPCPEPSQDPTYAYGEISSSIRLSCW